MLSPQDPRAAFQGSGLRRCEPFEGLHEAGSAMRGFAACRGPASCWLVMVALHRQYWKRP